MMWPAKKRKKPKNSTTKNASDDESKSSSKTSASGYQSGLGVSVVTPDGCVMSTKGSSTSPITGTNPGIVGEHQRTTTSTPNNSDLNTHEIPQHVEMKTPDVNFDLQPFLTELKQRKEDCEKLNAQVESLKSQIQIECSSWNQTLQEERYHYERLEEQMNDLIELHQNEIENLKQGIADMEEKVQYQSEERLRDVYEMLESCQTRVSRIEHQQHQHFQQLVNLDSFENSNARVIFLKLINVLLTILQVVLLLIATISNILTPFLQSRVRIVTTLLMLFMTMIIVKQWPDISSWINTKEYFSHYFPIIDHG